MRFNDQDEIIGYNKDARQCKTMKRKKECFPSTKLKIPQEEGHSKEEKKVNKPISRLIRFNTFNKG